MLGIIVFLGGIALAVAICAYPLVRRLTRRLERLQAGVESLGAGDLGARVQGRGQGRGGAAGGELQPRRRSASRSWSASHKLLLANASHELRTPLSRIRLGVELLKETADPKRKRDLEKDIAELDALDRRDPAVEPARRRAAGSTGARTSTCWRSRPRKARATSTCTVGGAPVVIARRPRPAAPPDPQPDRERRAARRAADRGRGARARDSRRRVTVSDRGPGVAQTDRERVFAPFFRIAGGQPTAGTGLGLTLVRQIARQHGGEVQWVGTPEQPSRIRVLLPFGGPPARRPSP